MGCARSKEAKCKHCRRSYSFSHHSQSSPIQRRSNFSDTTHNHRQSNRLSLSDAHSVISTVSNISGFRGNIKSYLEHRDGRKNDSKGNRNSISSIQSKSSSNSNNEKSRRKKGGKPPKSPTGEAETINTWELMEGLEGNTPRPRQSQTQTKQPEDDFSFPVAVDNNATLPHDSDKKNIRKEEENEPEDKPMWLHMAGNDAAPNSRSIVSDFDPEIISTFRKALEELSPQNALLLRTPGSGTIASPGHQRLFSMESFDRGSSPGHSRLFSKESLDSKELNNVILTHSDVCGDNKVVVYFTSLRGVRKTYEDSCDVRVIMKSMGVKIDEKDVSMHYGFREELRQLLGTEGLVCKLPRVFVKGKHIGGAEDVRRMHEDGELEKVIKGCGMVDESDTRVCDMCGDIRFIPCEMCSGSCKIYIETTYNGEEEEEENEERIAGFQRCPYCNENGIVRCPTCCS